MMKSKEQGLNPFVPSLDQASTQQSVFTPTINQSNSAKQEEIQAMNPVMPDINVASQMPAANTVLPTVPDLNGPPKESNGSNGAPRIASLFVEKTRVPYDQDNVEVFFNGVDPDWDPLSWVYSMSGALTQSGSFANTASIAARFSPKGEGLQEGDVVNVEATVQDPQGETDTADVDIIIEGKKETEPTTPSDPGGGGPSTPTIPGGPSGPGGPTDPRGSTGPGTVMKPQPVVQEPVVQLPEVAVDEGDRIVQKGGRGNDKILAFGEDGDDFIKQSGGKGKDKLKALGGGGNDTIIQKGGKGRDKLKAFGEAGNDTIVQKGGSGKDRLIADGGEGDDIITQKGGKGKDELIYMVSQGNDQVLMNGGKGRDEALIMTNGLPVIIKNSKGKVLYADEGAKTVITLKRVKHFSVIGADNKEIAKGGKGFAGSIPGSKRKNPKNNDARRPKGKGRGIDRRVRKNGSGGNDRLRGRGSRRNDRIRLDGRDGDDVLRSNGRRGRDRLLSNGGNGNDRIRQRGGRGRDRLRANGGAGNDNIKQRGGRGRDNLRANGGAGNDRIRQNGGRGRDRLHATGGRGRDNIKQRGGRGNDTLVAGNRRKRR